MITYEDLLNEAENNKLIAKEKKLIANKGRIKGNLIAIKRGLTETEKKCVLAEELGHHYTSVGNIIDISNTSNRKQEQRARIWAYNQQIGLTGLVNAYLQGCRNRCEIAEYLEVAEEFLQDCLDSYHSKYGISASIDNYIIFFEPLGVMGF